MTGSVAVNNQRCLADLHMTADLSAVTISLDIYFNLEFTMENED
jgi:hypothetical protein